MQRLYKSYTQPNPQRVLACIQTDLSREKKYLELDSLLQTQLCNEVDMGAQVYQDNGHRGELKQAISCHKTPLLASRIPQSSQRSVYRVLLEPVDTKKGTLIKTNLYNEQRQK